MEWRDEGVIISVRKHGETSAIVDVLTAEHGRSAGVVRGGTSRRMTPILQIGTQVEVEWRARLEEHLGSYRIEPLKSRSRILSDRLALAGLGSVAALITFAFPKRLVMPDLYDQTIDVLDRLESGAGWMTAYTLWERDLLEELGFGLDLRNCAATGATDDLIFVSPKSGRAVSRKGGQEWADRLLPLPKFFSTEDGPADHSDVADGLRTTGYFMEKWLAPSLGDRSLPDARHRLVERFIRMGETT